MPLRLNSKFDLTDRAVLVTGAASGIGAATARALAAAGAHVVAVDLPGKPLEAIGVQLGDGALTVPADVTDLGAMRAAVDAATSRFGSLDACFANAGIAAKKPTTISGSSVEEFEKIIEVNLFGAWRTVRACLPEIQAVGGHVLITASVYAFVNGVVNAPYAMSKVGVESFGRALRAETGGTGMTVGLLYPGWVKTPIIEAAHRKDSVSLQLLQRAFPAPMLKPISPERVAEAAVRGFQRRSPRIVVPRWWTPVSVARGVVDLATDAVLARDGVTQALIRKVDD